MVDTARKHFSADWLLARLDEMADLKLNQLGLHFSDDQAFRIESDKHPEIDSPGHLGAVLKAHPGLQLKSGDGTRLPGAIDVSKPAAADLTDDLLDEFAPLFPGTRWHLGGDEYLALQDADPEAHFPHLAAAARERHGPRAKVADLTAGWLNDRADRLRAHGKKTTAWNDGFVPGAAVRPDADRQVEYWTGKEIGALTPEPFLKQGRKVINTHDEYLYYVLGEPNDFDYPTGKRIYHVPGARLAVWCDQARAQSAQQVARGIRLPLAALAQKVWSPSKPPQSWEEFRTLTDQVSE
ncbi:family 20 glycosylhydrolase [Streptomyces coryli]|uniref:family 20 glycosylhydrolase n=1 Tax=Streptomyces coryli TaxID=1128680 RepID=UPI0030B8B2C5